MMLDEERSSAMAFWSAAKSYHNAASFLNTAYLEDRIQLPYDDPVLFLVGHSAELAFKAHLRSEGWTLNQLIGHNLIELFSEAKTNKLPTVFSELEEQHLRLLNELHGRRPYQTRYPKTGSYTAPSPKIVIQAVDRVLGAIRPSCLPKGLT